MHVGQIVEDHLIDVNKMVDVGSPGRLSKALEALKRGLPGYVPYTACHAALKPLLINVFFEKMAEKSPITNKPNKRKGGTMNTVCG